MPGKTKWIGEAACLALLLCVITVVWCDHYHRWKAASWKYPPMFTADKQWPRWQGAFYGNALWCMATVKARADGEVGFFDKEPRSLGAPYRANWNDWPTMDEGIGVWTALLANIFGLFQGLNVALLSAHLLAAATFYVVCRYLNYSRWPSFAGATLFALSRYAFWRGLPHLSLTYYWHVPLALVVLWWCVREFRILRERNRLLVCTGVAIVFGVQDPFYAAMFLQLLLGTAVICGLRHKSWEAVIPPLFVACIVVATVAVMNVDTFAYSLTHGANTEINRHSYPDVQVGALKPVELFIPSSHTTGKIESWAKEGYYTKALFLGEAGASYLGLIGIIAVLLLAGFAMRSVARNNFIGVPIHFWGILSIVVYSMVGGLNGFFGLFDLFYLRATNRYSIVILAAALLFLVKQLSHQTRKWPRWSAAWVSIFVGIIGVQEQIPPRPAKQERATTELMQEDGRLVSAMESKFVPGAMIFELPAMAFPEPTPIANMVEYEPLRPYLHSHDLRFSYGDDKGRPRSSWQSELDTQDAHGLIATLERYGFSGLLINKRGFEDRAVSLLTDVRATGKERIAAESDDFVCVRLNPWRQPLMPPEFAVGWYPLERIAETSFRWSEGDAKLVLHNGSAREQAVRLTFGLSVAGERYVGISLGDQTVYEGVIAAEEGRRSVDLTVALQPGVNELRFRSDRPGMLLPGGDPRKLAFAVSNLRLRKVTGL